MSTALKQQGHHDKTSKSAANEKICDNVYIIFQNNTSFSYTGGYNHYVIAAYLKYFP